MCYHFAIIHLFRPFFNLGIVGSNLSPESICHQAAHAMQGLLKSYSGLYTLHRTPSLLSYLVLASAIAHLDLRAKSIQTTLPTPGSA